jgi:hypothetical protein
MTDVVKLVANRGVDRGSCEMNELAGDRLDI